MRQVLAFGIVFAAAAAALPAGQADETPASTSSPQAAARARKLLDESGVRGGLVVHIGCGEQHPGALTAALRASESLIVHGLDANAGVVAKARTFVRSAGIYGPVSIDLLRGERLPYADNLVNLVVADELGKVSVREVMRVLCPDGVAWIGRKKTVKPRPANIDEWTHYLHGPDNNAVAKDSVVDQPRRIQWVGAPRWARSHDHLASTSAMVSAGGRMFAIVDEGSIAAIALQIGRAHV